jgi:glycosyltransferase involved in cell wall biosynthesis
MKIGIDARFYHPRHSGNSRLQRELIKSLLEIDPPTPRLRRAGHQNQYVIFVTKEGAEAFAADFSKKPANVRLVIFDHPHYSFAEQFQFISVIKKQKLDLMHFAHINHPIFYRDPFVITMPDLTLYYYPGKEKLNFIKRWAYNMVMLSAINHSRKIIAVSKNTKKELIEKLNAPARKIKVIYEGADQQFKMIKNEKKRQAILKKYQIKKSYLIYLGQGRAHKNLPRLIEGFSQAIRQGLDAQLILVGRQDRGTVNLERLVKQLGMSKRIILTGFVSDDELPYLYRSATAYVFPSLSEGFGLPPLEAMACGIPVISSNASCMPEVLEEAALYFDPFDPQDIARAIKKIMSDGKLRREMIKKGFKQVKKYSWQKMAKETLVLYNRIGKSKN